MKEFSAQEIQQKFEGLPEDIQVAISSPEVHDLIFEIGKKNGLMIDQTGHLVDQVGLVLLGLAQASRFVDDVSKQVGIPKDVASKIANQINTEVFSKIRRELRENDEKKELEEKTVSSFEKAGGFNVERVEDEPGQSGIEIQNKEQIISSIENPEPSKENKFPKNEIYTEPLVDQLLGSSTGRAVTKEHHTEAPPQNLPIVEEGDKEHVEENKVVIPNPPIAKPAPINQSKPKGPDVYREPID